MNFDEWIEIGIKNSWAGPPVCYTHDGLPTSSKEDDEMELDDPCIHIVRLYEHPDDRLHVEDNHAPSKWRNQWLT